MDAMPVVWSVGIPRSPSLPGPLYLIFLSCMTQGGLS